MSPTVHLPTFQSSASPLGIAERWAGASGVAASLLIFFAGAFAPGPPTHGGTDAAMLEHFRMHHDGTMKGVLVWMLGAMALLLFAAAVTSRATRAKRAMGTEPGVSGAFARLVGAIAVGMLVAAQAGAAATARVGHHATDPAIARGLDEIGHMLAHLSVIPLGLFTLALAVTLLDARLGSRWLAAAGVPIGLGMAATGAWVVVGGDMLHNVGGGITWLGSMLWWVAVGVTLVLTGRRTRVRGAVAAPAAAAAA